MRVTPGRARAAVTSVPGGIRIEVSLRPRGLELLGDVGVAAMAIVWTILIVVGETRPPELPGDRSGPWGLWFVGVVLALAVLSTGKVLVRFSAKETVDLTDRMLRVRRSAFRLARTKEYDVPHVRRIRAAVREARPWLGNPRGGAVAFDYGAATIRFLPGIEEAEATDVAGRLEARLRETRPTA